MAQKSSKGNNDNIYGEKNPAGHNIHILYGDLASEVIRRRSTMPKREETLAKKSCKAYEMLIDLDSDSEQVPCPNKVSAMVPPAPPPSPAEDFTDT